MKCFAKGCDIERKEGRSYCPAHTQMNNRGVPFDRKDKRDLEFIKHKKCCRCHKQFPRIKFNASNRTKDGLSSYCAPCDAIKREERNARRRKSWQGKHVELSELVAERRDPATISILPAGSAWAKWWRDFV